MNRVTVVKMKLGIVINLMITFIKSNQSTMLDEKVTGGRILKLVGRIREIQEL